MCTTRSRMQKSCCECCQYEPSQQLISNGEALQRLKWLRTERTPTNKKNNKPKKKLPHADLIRVLCSAVIRHSDFPILFICQDWFVVPSTSGLTFFIYTYTADFDMPLKNISKWHCVFCRVSGSPSFLIWASVLPRHSSPQDQDHHLGPHYDGSTHPHTHTHTHTHTLYTQIKTKAYILLNQTSTVLRMWPSIIL